jgi:hypothetical protein
MQFEHKVLLLDATLSGLCVYLFRGTYLAVAVAAHVAIGSLKLIASQSSDCEALKTFGVRNVGIMLFVHWIEIQSTADDKALAFDYFSLLTSAYELASLGTARESSRGRVTRTWVQITVIYITVVWMQFLTAPFLPRIRDVWRIVVSNCIGPLTFAAYLSTSAADCCSLLHSS